MRKIQISRALGLALLLALLASPGRLVAAEGVKPELRQELLDAYHRTVKEPQYLALTERLRGNQQNRAVVDPYLAYLPISPLEMLKIDMQVKRYEIAIPKLIFQYHERWKQLHPEAAKRYYPEEKILEEIEPATESGQGPRQITAAATVGTNRNVAYNFPIPPTDYQGEIQLVINLRSPKLIVAAANTWDQQGGACGDLGLQAIFYSGDGGVTWGNTCPPDDVAYGLNCAALGGLTFGSDPALSWNRSHEVFLNHMLLCLITPQDIRYAMVVARSTDFGATWTAQGIVKSSWPNPGIFEDKNFYAIDNYKGSSPFYTRHYTCWDRNNNEKFAYSTNNGVNWTEVDLPTPPGGGFDLGCDIAVQKNGTVHVIWNTLTCGAVCTNERTFYTRSTNGGVTWSAPVLVVDPNLTGFSNQNCPLAQNDRCIGPFGSIDVDNAGGLCDGTLYVTYTDFPTGGNVNNSDIFVRRSTDGGNTWSAGVRVNDDGSGGRIQFHPFLVVDQVFGAPVVAWHDARNDANNRAVDFFVARSSSCGLTFEANIQASQPSTEFNNSTISSSNMSSTNPGANPNEYGEYLGLDARLAQAYIAWTDTRHYFPSFTTEPQRENVGFVHVDLGPDQIPPLAPTGLTATAGSGAVSLDWNDNTEADLAAYRVYIATASGGPYTVVGTATVSNFTVTGLITGTTYYFVVTALDINGIQSRYSQEVSATP